jgi:hypothetical protein
MPLDPMTGEWLEAVSVAQEVQPMLPEGFIRPEWLVKMDDRLVADFYQQLLDVFWERSQADLWVRQNVLDTNIQGWSHGLYQWDDIAKRHRLMHMALRHVYIDPTVRDVSEAAYVGIDIALDAHEAMALYPELGDVIEQEAQTGVPTQPDSISQWADQFNKNFYRPMVTLRVFWLRNQPMALSKEEAVAAGLIQEVEAPGGQFEQSAGIFGKSVRSEQEPLSDGSQQLQPEAAEQPALPEQGPAAAGLEGDGEPLQDDAQSPLGDAASPAYLGSGRCISTLTGEEIDPKHPDWPTRLVVRQIKVIASRVVEDRESEFFDGVPILHNVNIPLPGARPQGLGEPFRLAQLQSALSRNVSALVEVCDFYASPASGLPASVAEDMEQRYGDAFVRPGRTMVWPDDVWMAMGGDVSKSIIQPPPLPPATAELVLMLKQFIQEQSGYTQAQRGVSPSPNASGKMVELLQSSGASLMGFKGKRTGDMVRRLANLMLHSLVWRLEVEDIVKIISKYPHHVVEAIHARAREIEWNVTVNVEASTGMLQAQKRQLGQMDMQIGVKSPQTYCEEVGINYRTEMDRITAHLQRQQKAGMMPAGEGSANGDGGQQQQGQGTGGGSGQ